MKNYTYLITTISPLQILTYSKTKIFKDCGIKLQWIRAISLFKLFLLLRKKDTFEQNLKKKKITINH